MNRNWTILLASAAVVVGVVLFREVPCQSAGTSLSDCVAVCNVADILENSQRTKPLKDELRNKEEQLKAEGEKRAKAIDAAQKELQSLKEGSEEYEKKLNDILNMTMELEAWKSVQEKVLARWHYRVTKAMFEEVRQEIEKVAKEQGYTVVLQAEPTQLAAANSSQLIQELSQRRVLYSDKSVDITELVLARINKSATASSKP